MRNVIRGLGMAVLGLALGACNDSGPVEGRRSGKSEVCTAPSAGSEAAVPPQTIPALQLWTPASGTYRYGPASRIVIAGGDGAALSEVAAVLAEDLQIQGGHRPAIVSGASAAAGDILLSRGDCDSRLGTEGYGLKVGDSVEIQAGNSAGVFYGTRTLLQLLAQDSAIAAGHALDWPRYPERGLLVDAGRKYFTPDWFRQHVRELAWLKLNILHLHFSEDLGFRIASERHPEIVSEAHLTKAEVREIVALARRYHISVIGEIGMPGHMGAALAPHPEFQLANDQGEKAPNKLDITNPDARQFARELIEEYLPLFPGMYWHAGGDEYLASADYPRYPQLETYAREQYGPEASSRDAVLGFMNEIDDLLRSHGRSTRFWHDGTFGGTAVTVHPDTVVEWWTDFNPLGELLPPSPQEFLDRGHRISNASYWPLYYTVGGAAGFPPGLPPRPDLCSFYEGWEVHQFYGALNAPAVACQTVHLLPVKTVAADEPRNLGAKLFVFTDGPEAETETQIAEGIAPRLRIVAQKTWNSPPLTPRYAEFEPIAQRIGHAPGYQIP